jgi:trimethylamine--corrinoid protein Co-methyltransferase
MAKEAFIRRNINYRVWDDKQCAEVVDTAFRVLERTGCLVHNEKARNLLKEAGCVVDKDNVRIPYGLTQWAVSRAPRSVVVYDRNGEPAMVLSPDRVHFGPTITNTQIVDIETGEARPASKEDSKKAALVMDSLKHISWVSGFNSISDLDQKVADIAEMHAILPNTTKPVMYWANNTDNLAVEFEMFAAVAGGADAFRAKPFGLNLICPMDPLMHTDNGLAQIMFMAEKASPALYIPGIAFGLSGPVTLAGGIAVGLADTLGGLVVSQLTRPGTPFVASKFNDNLDMRSASMSHSRPEMLIAQCATSDVFRYLKLPFCSNFGSTDSGSFDGIAIFDKAVHLYSALLSGVNMVFSLGTYEAGSLTKLEDLVFCDEVLSFLRILVEGIPITADTLAEDVINTVGPGGNFMTTKHTISNFKNNWNPDLLKPLNFAKSREVGPGDLESKIKQRTLEIIAKGPQKHLSSEVETQLDAIMDKALASL